MQKKQEADLSAVRQGDAPAAAAEGKREQDARKQEETRAFSKRLNAAKERWKSEYDGELFETLGLTDPWQAGKPITSREELRELAQKLKQQESGGMMTDAAELERMRSELGAYRDKEQDAALLNDPVKGPFYKQMRDEAMEVVQFARAQGQQLDLESAFDALLIMNLERLLRDTRAQAEQETLTRLTENSQATPSALGGAPVENKLNYDAMSDAEFSRIVQMALNGELKRS